jgi:hypothetical protein
VNSVENVTFDEIHHALLFAWIANAVVARVGVVQGESLIRQAVRQYGEERGHRMALRADAHRHKRNMLNFIAYSEFKVLPGNMEQTIIAKTPDIKVHVTKCPWYQTWEENQLLMLGRLYCLEIDHALVRGFNPQLVLHVNGTRTNGADCCEFIYNGADLRFWNYFLMMYRKVVNPGNGAVLPWDYHTSHLFHTLQENIINELGEQGRKVVNEGLLEFSTRYGESAVQKIRDYQAMDFKQLPGI